MKDLDAGEFPLRKVFSSDFEFVIPDYQRPYSWRTEQALQLLDDLEGALDLDTDEPYFLGSIVLVTDRSDPRSEVIDGQQRLTTLSLLFAILRDLTKSRDLAGELGEFVLEPGRIMAGTKAKPRLTLRKRDQRFFADYIQQPGQIDHLISLDGTRLPTDAQRALHDNAHALMEKLRPWPESQLQRLAAMLGTRTFLVVVSTPNLNSAHRIFSVMNARGLDLTPADIFKSLVIGELDGEEASSYADKWEQEEQDLGRDGFAELFGHIRMIFAKERSRRELLQEFKSEVLAKYLPDRAREFIDEVLLPYSDAYEHLTTQNYPTHGSWGAVNDWLARLMQIDNSDWRPPALWALRHHGNDPVYLAEFLRRLERVAASMLVRRMYATPRGTRYAELLKQLESGDGFSASAFDLDASEVSQTRSQLDGDIYLHSAVRKYVLLRLDELLANQPGVSYQHKMITVEHVLPQNPKPDSDWAKNFSEQDHVGWLHRLSNLVLLNRAKNSEAQRYDFDEKKRRYFTGRNGVVTFALTSQVLRYESWTPSDLTARQDELLRRLYSEWEL